MTVTATEKRHATRVVRALNRAYPDVTCALVHADAFQLLVATILSAQCTDQRVNLVTRELFKHYRTPQDFASLPLAKLEKAIQSTGFFRNKAKNIKNCSCAIVARHAGEVPAEMDELVALAGVGRKTANVVLGTAFGKATGVVVDTHVARISRRLGLTSAKDPVKIEQDLMAVLARRQWIDFAHRMIHHGRQICKARKPLCDECPMQNFCPQIGLHEKG